MPHPFRSLSLLACVFLVQAACTAPDTDADPRPGEPEAASPASTSEEVPATSASSAGTSTRGVLPGLFAIMAGLEQNLTEVSRGIWLEDYAGIQAAAEAVAGHPAVPPEELELVSEALGADLARFKEWDKTVHDLAVRMAEAAKDQEMSPVLSVDSELRAGCVGCHSEFRERLREAIR